MTKLTEKAEEKRNEIKRKIATDVESYEGDNKQYNIEDLNEELKDMVTEMGFMIANKTNDVLLGYGLVNVALF
ncbi:hypothetical protein RJZ90_007660 [Blastomyces dermatitidis]|nr:hypothetical protein BDFG_06479 [Blastomyces dermatitidis ATCC 26199]